MLDLIVKGGPVMMLILVGSVIGLAMVLERSWMWWRLRLDTEAFTARTVAYVRAGSMAQAREHCAARQHPVAQVLHIGLLHADDTVMDRDRVLQHEGDRVMMELEHHMGTLSSIVTISPLLGFLGTITGLLMSFRAWEYAGADVTVSDLAAGISQAMLTTAAGLIVAIPFFLAYNYFLQRAKRMAFAMTDAGNELQRALGPTTPATSRDTHAHTAVA
jgi:biopolymer transport protein ExbB